MEQEPIKTEVKRNEDGTFAEGTAPGPGRPKGKTLKEWMREKLLGMTLEQREDFLKEIPKDLQWKMAEGNPAQDVTSGGEKIEQIPIYGGISRHNGDKKDIPASEENKGSVGGDVSQ